MAKKQTRRSISVSRDLYTKLTETCEVNGVAVSRMTELAMRELIETDANATRFRNLVDRAKRT